MTHSKTQPLVTILTLNYNHKKYCIDTLESIRLQSYTNFELIIIDNGSSDGSVDLIRKWKDGYPELSIAFITNKDNIGISKAINQGIKLAAGQYIAMVACDDLLSPLKIETQINAFAKDAKDIGMVYSDANVIDSKGDTQSYSWFDKLDHSYDDKKDLFISLLQRNFILPAATLVKKSVFEQIGGFDETLSFEDYDMNLRIVENFNVAYSNYKSASYRRHDSNASLGMYTRHADSYIKVMSKYLTKDERVNQIVSKRIRRIIFFATAEDFNNGQMLQRQYLDISDYPWYVKLAIKNRTLMNFINTLRNWYKK